MKKMCKKISAFVLLFVYLLVLCPTVLATGATTIDETALTTVPATSYVAEESSMVEADTTVASRIIISAGGTVSYKVVVPKDGFYKLLVYGKNAGSKSDVTVCVDGTELTSGGTLAYFGIGMAQSGDYNQTIGRFYLTAGERLITLSFSKEVNIKEILLKSVELDIPSSGETIFEAHDYLTANITAASHEDLQSTGYKTTNTGVTVTGPVIITAGVTQKRSCTYKVNVAQAGLYTLKAYSAFHKPTGIELSEITANFALSVDGVQIAKATHVPTVSGVSKCEGTTFQTFNLKAGEQNISISSGITGDGSHLYTYYYTIERIDDLRGGDISANNITVIEGEDLFYTENGVEPTDGAMKISAATARADVDVLDSGLYAVALRYRADSDTSVYLRMGSRDEKYQTLPKTKGEYVDFVYQMSKLDTGLLRILLNTEDTVYIDSIRFIPVDEELAQTFVTSVNAAEKKDDLFVIFETFAESSGIDFNNASQCILYKDPLYERILEKDYKDIEDFSLAFAEYVAKEGIMERITVNNGTKDILGLESGNLTVTLDTKYFAEMDASIAAAIYEEGYFKKLNMVDIKEYNGEPEITFNFENLILDENKTYSFKIIYFNDLETIAPKEMYKDVYKEIYVSEKGSDVSGDGSEDAPFASIQKAIDYAESFSDNQQGDIVIKVDSGTYTLSETLMFDETNSGKNGFNLIIEGNQENPPVISGGEPVIGWTEEENGIWSAPVSNVEYVRNLYINGYPAVRARSDERYEAETIHYYGIPTTVYKGGSVALDSLNNLNASKSGFDTAALNEQLKKLGHESIDSSAKDGFSVPKDYVPYEFNLEEEDLELVWIYTSSNNWESRRTPVEKITNSASETTFILDRALLKYISSRFRNGNTFYLENAKSLLDEPGEFYYNKKESRVYYMPHDGEDMTNAETYVGKLEQMVSIKGSSVGAKAENITFKNLVFRYGAYDFASKYGYDGQQADAFQSNFRGEDGTEQQLAQIYVENAKGIEIKDCEISCMGSAGIHFKEGVNESLIEGNMIRDLSGTGVIIGHPDHRTKKTGVTVCDNIVVKNNVFRRNAAEYFNNTQISLYCEKNIDIVHNDIDMAPYSGITGSWGWEGAEPYDCENVDISYNKITNVMQMLNDGGAIYTVGALRDSIISNNYINGSKGTVAGVMYQDSGSAYLEVFNNVILNASKSIYRNPTWDHDLKYYNNYSNISAYEKSIPEKNIEVEAPIQVDADNLTGEALEIANAAGLESEYKHLLSKDKFPSWRKSRISLPSYTDNSITKIDASKFIPSASSEGLELVKSYTTSSVIVMSGEHITFPMNIEESGTYKVLIYGNRVAANTSTKVAVADYTEADSGLGFSNSALKRYTIGRYEFTKGDDEIRFNVSNGGGIEISAIYIKKVEQNILPDITNIVEVHDYYSSNINSYNNEDNQYGYETEGNNTIIMQGPVIAHGSGGQRKLTYKMNVAEGGTYNMKIYYAGGASVTYSVLVNGEEVGTVSAEGTNSSDPNKCNEAVISGITLPSGDITFGLNYTATGSGHHIYAYYYELEKVQ